MEMVPLCDLRPGDGGIVRQLNTIGSMRRRLIDLGMIPDGAVVCVGVSPAGDPAAYGVRGAVVALRQADAATVLVQRWEEDGYGAQQGK